MLARSRLHTTRQGTVFRTTVILDVNELVEGSEPEAVIDSSTRYPALPTTASEVSPRQLEPAVASHPGVDPNTSGNRVLLPQVRPMPAKKQSKWSPEEDALIIRLRATKMKWDDISARLDGRSAISCRLHYQNYLERRCEWNEESLNRLARLYDRFKLDMWEMVANELELPVRAVEAMHWQMGEEEMIRRAGASQFTSIQSHNNQGPSRNGHTQQLQRRSVSSGTEPVYQSNGHHYHQDQRYAVHPATGPPPDPSATDGYGVRANTGPPLSLNRQTASTQPPHHTPSRYAWHEDQNNVYAGENIPIPPLQLSPERPAQGTVLPSFRELSTGADSLSTPSYAYSPGTQAHYTVNPGPYNTNVPRSSSPGQHAYSSAYHTSAHGPSTATSRPPTRGTTSAPHYSPLPDQALPASYIPAQGHSVKRRASPNDATRDSRRARHERRRSPHASPQT